MLGANAIAENYIAGEWVGGDRELRDSVNPADGSVLGRYRPGSARLADQAAAVARETFETTGWGASPRLRATVLDELADRLEEARDDLVELIVAENGKLRAEAIGEMMGSISETRYYAGLARAFQGRTQETAPGNFSILHREPAGVAAIIVPWNAPVTLLIRSLAPALAAGCTTVIKPAPQASLIHARVMQCIEACRSLPEGRRQLRERGRQRGRRGARRLPRRRRDQLHRLEPHRLAHHGGRRADAEAAVARARRQGAVADLSRRRPRPRRARADPRLADHGGPDVRRGGALPRPQSPARPRSWSASRRRSRP